MQIGFNIQVNVDTQETGAVLRLANAIYALGQAVGPDVTATITATEEPPKDETVADISNGVVTKKRKTAKEKVAAILAADPELPFVPPPLEPPAVSPQEPAVVVATDVPAVSEVRDAAAAYAKHFGAPAGFVRAADLIKEFGGTKVSDVPESRRAAFISKVQATIGKK